MSHYVVGLTGGIGSGKTVASDRFELLGIDVVDADLAARVVVEPGTPALQEIANHFGASFLQKDGSLDRAALRERVFKDEQALTWLNALTHPLIGIEIASQLKNASSSYAILVSPLLMETVQKDLCHRLLVIDVPPEVQAERAAARDGNDPGQIRRIMASQTDRETRLAQADDVLLNTGSLEDLHKGVDSLHRSYLKMSEEHDPNDP